MPLEALRWDLTPVGLHYLLVLRRPAGRGLGLAPRGVGRRRAAADPLARRSPRAFEHRPHRDDGVRRQRPRPARAAAVEPTVAHGSGRDCALARGSRSQRCSRRRDPAPTRSTSSSVGSTAAWREGVEQQYERSLPLAEALDAGGVLAFEMNGVPLPPQHGFPLRLVVPGWYGMTNVKWLTTIRVDDQPFDGYQVVPRTASEPGGGRGGPARHADEAPFAVVPPGVPDFFSRERVVAARSTAARGRRSGRAPGRAGRGEHGRRHDLASTRRSARRPAPGRGAAGRSDGRRPRGAPPLLEGDRRDGGDPAARAGGTSAAREQRRSAGPRSSSADAGGAHPVGPGTPASPAMRAPGRSAWLSSPRSPRRASSRRMRSPYALDGNTTGAVHGYLACTRRVRVVLASIRPGSGWRCRSASRRIRRPRSWVSRPSASSSRSMSSVSSHRRPPVPPDEPPRSSSGLSCRRRSRSSLPPRRAPRRRHVGRGPCPLSARDSRDAGSRRCPRLHRPSRAVRLAGPWVATHRSPSRPGAQLPRVVRGSRHEWMNVLFP